MSFLFKLFIGIIIGAIVGHKEIKILIAKFKGDKK